jgi:mono/diheme cytochrome c family protein
MHRLTIRHIALVTGMLFTSASLADGGDLARKTAEMDPAARDGGLTWTVECPADATAAEACKVDRDTYNGWRSFSTHCLACHGGSAMGSSFAPNLMDRLNAHVDHERFIHVLKNGYVGKMGAMPSFATNPGVLKDTDRIYRYLRARADRVLPPGRPAKLPD